LYLFQVDVFKAVSQPRTVKNKLRFLYTVRDDGEWEFELNFPAVLPGKCWDRDESYVVMCCLLRAITHLKEW
jgi:hypothetical protein